MLKKVTARVPEPWTRTTSSEMHGRNDIKYRRGGKHEVTRTDPEHKEGTSTCLRFKFKARTWMPSSARVKARPAPLQQAYTLKNLNGRRFDSHDGNKRNKMDLERALMIATALAGIRGGHVDV
ncbi:uncharacterized protein PAC_14491 [Phialocephala subalpina]|uniref:Uncharacterized protein n=1 Tax=Phialocephala subalpina TaxID=576137 RepID=A0A1L7XHS3_9HELO|nr:uncharacterized protein PAC_14491 [Phialocephala subalpina]